MKIKEMLCCAVVLAAVGCQGGVSRALSDNSSDLTEEMKDSLVYLDVSVYAYDQMQPWKPADVVGNSGFGSAVGPYEVLTTAWNAADAVLIKARRYGQNDYIPAKVKVIDYESNLCLIELDSEAMDGPLVPIEFVENYQEGAGLKSYWLSSGGHLMTGRAYLDRAKVNVSMGSYARFINFVAADTSTTAGRGSLYCMGKEAIGIACWADGDLQEAGLIPALTINEFLADAAEDDYEGFGATGFVTRTLLDPAQRAWLKMPEDLQHGVYIPKVYNLGTGSDALQEGDVVLAIDGESLNPYGRFLHPEFDRISFRHLITSHRVGETVTFDIWRGGKEEQLKVKAQNFKAAEMLVPYYEHKGPEYFVTGGYIFVKMTRSYLTMWGDDWAGKVPSHLYHYYRDESFAPEPERRDIVLLSYVLPHDINLGYQGLGRLVVKKFNGMEIAGISDIIEAKKLRPESKFDVVEFEQDYPTVVIPREGLEVIDAQIAQRYGIGKLSNIE